MKSRPPHRIAAVVTLGLVLLQGQRAHGGVKGQDDASAIAVLLGRARTLEQRGRLDLAKQDWSQVLLADPNEAEALAGLVRAARSEGRSADADKYLARLRSAHPNSTELAQLGNAAGGTENGKLLAEAERLARGGDPRGAMALYRRVYGLTPPSGAPALAYYGTEGATDEGRPHAVAGLRALADRYPADTRYQVALGRVLLGSSRTRAEGRTLLEGLPGNPEAVAALRGTAPVTSSTAGVNRAATQGAAPSSGGSASATRSAERPVQVASGAAPEAKRPASERTAVAAPDVSKVQSPPVPRSGTMRGVLVSAPSGSHRMPYLAEEQAAFAALSEHRNGQAEQIFRDILAKDPKDARALAGMGYVLQARGDLKPAVMFFEQAQENGDRSLALARAIVGAQFELAVKQAGADRSRGDLPGAEGQYRAALKERPNDPEALDGLGGTLLQEWRFGEAVPVFEHLTRVRPLDPGAWRGLVMAEASAGRGGAAITADAQVPSAAKAPLLRDQAYQRALSVARGSQGVEIARAEPPVRPAPTPPNANAASGSASAVPPKAAAPPPVAVATAPPAASVAPPPVAPAPNPAARSATRPSVAVAGAAASAPSAGAAKPASSRPPVSAATSAPAPGLGPVRAPAPSDAEEIQQANVALLSGRDAEAATMFRALATRTPERAEGWRGLVLALHNGGHDAEAASALADVPTSAHDVLDRDATFQVAAGAVLLASHQPNEALRAYARAQDVFTSQHLQPPLEVVMDTARLLAARGDDENLYRELMYLGERRDLTDTRRVEVQMIWTRWAVRRARALAAGGEDRRAIALLNAAATAFAGNADVLHAVADGYTGIGKPREAVAIYRTQELATMSAAILETAVSAATAARDFRTAESWMRVGLERFPNDPQMLNTAAELAQARGRERRAVEFSQQARALAPAQNPGQVLAAELRESPAGQGWPGHSESGGGQLSSLLAPGSVTGTTSAKPYLPAAADKSAGVAATGGEPPVLGDVNEPSR